MTPFHLFLALLCILFWGASFPISKVILGEISPLFLVAVRFLITGALVAPFTKFPRKDIKDVLVFTLFMGVLMTPLFYFGLQNLSASASVLLVQTQVPIASLMAAIFFSEMLGKQRAIGISLAFIGIIFIVGNPHLDGTFSGVLFTLGAAICFPAGSLYAKRLKHISGFTLNAWMNVFAAIPILILSFIFESPSMEMLEIFSHRHIFWLTSSLIVGSIFCYSVWYFLLQNYEINQVMPLSMLEPVFGIWIAVVFLGESLSTMTAIGGIFTMTGVGVVIFKRRPFQRVYKP